MLWRSVRILSLCLLAALANPLPGAPPACDQAPPSNGHPFPPETTFPERGGVYRHTRIVNDPIFVSQSLPSAVISGVRFRWIWASPLVLAKVVL